MMKFRPSRMELVKLLGLFVFICHLESIGGNLINITFEPHELVVKVRETLPVFFNLSLNLEEVALNDLDKSTFGQLEVSSDDTGLAEVTNGTAIQVDWQNVVKEPRTFRFDVSGRFTGRTKIKIRGWKLPDYKQGVIAEYSVAVLRMETMTTLSLVFTVVMSILIAVNTFVMGLQLDWRIIISVFKKPVAPVIGFLCQYFIMPLVATAWAFAFLSGIPYLQFGYFAVGCAPGGGASNFWTLLLDGNLDLSVTMTFCSNMAALAMMPFWLFTLGRVFFIQAGGENISIPFENIVGSLVLLIGPVFAGILVKHYRPQFAEKSKKWVKISTVIIICVAVVFGSISNVYVYYLLTWKTLLCGLLLPWIGFALSYLVAFLIRQDHRNCRTIAIETGIQNAGIAIVLLQTSLKRPESDLAMVMPVCVLIFTPLPLVIALIVKAVLNFRRTRKEKEAAMNSIQLDAKPHEQKWADSGTSRTANRCESDEKERNSEEAEPMLDFHSNSQGLRTGKPTSV